MVISTTDDFEENECLVHLNFAPVELRGRAALPRSPSLPFATAHIWARCLTAGQMGSVDIDGGDVLRLIMQFLREQGLDSSLKTLQDETGVALNAVDNADAFAADVMAGRWDLVVSTVATLKLPPPVLMTLYEHIVRELVEARDGDSARALLRSTLPLLLLKQESPARFAALEAVVARSGAAALYEGSSGLVWPEGSSREQRRREVASLLLEHVGVAPPSRLLTLLGQAVKWQQFTGQLPEGVEAGAGGAGTHAGEGARLDLFKGAPAARRVEEERLCNSGPGPYVIKYGASARPECGVWSADGRFLITGSADGLIEVYDARTGKLRTADLPYQAADEFMMHDDAVHSLALSRDGELLASGGKDGYIKVWRLSTGECLRKFSQAHGDSSISCLAFSRDASQLLSGGGDGVVRVFGLRSGKCLKECRGHAAAVVSVGWLGLADAATSPFASASTDGTVRIWDSKTSECVAAIKPPQPMATSEAPVHTAFVLPRAAAAAAVAVAAASAAAATAGGSGAPAAPVAVAVTSDQLVVCNRSAALYLMTTGGGLIRTYSTDKKHGAGHDLVAACCSPNGRWLYAADEAGCLWAWNVATGSCELAGTTQLQAGGSVGGLLHHPQLSLLASFGDDGTLKTWRG